MHKSYFDKCSNMQRATRHPLECTRALVAILLVAHTVSGGSCPADCNTFKINDPPDPESGFNGVSAAAAIIAGIANAMISPIFSDAFQTFGYMGGGLFTGIFGSVEAQDESEWTRYQQQKDLQQQQDYLACIMESQISQVAYEGKQYFDNTRIAQFNNAVSGVVTFISESCSAHNVRVARGGLFVCT